MLKHSRAEYESDVGAVLKLLVVIWRMCRDLEYSEIEEELGAMLKRMRKLFPNTRGFQ